MNLKINTHIKNILFPLIAILLVSSVMAQTPLTIWEKTYSQGEECYVATGILSSSGKLIIAGLDDWVLCIDSAGNKLWTKERNISGAPVQVNGIDECVDNGFILCGLGMYRHPWLQKIDSIGTVEWTIQYDIFSECSDFHCILQTPDRGYVVGGHYDETNDYQAFLLKTDSLGNINWIKNYTNSSGFSEIKFVKETGSGGYILCGSKYVNYSFRESWLFKVDSLGVIEWEKRSGNKEINSITFPNDSQFVVCGERNKNAFVEKYSNNGDLIWTNLVDNEYQCFYTTIEALDDNSYLLCGTIHSSSDYYSRQMWVVKADSIGKKIWDYRYYNDQMYSFGKFANRTNDGSYFVCGNICKVNEYNGMMALVVYLDSTENNISENKKALQSWSTIRHHVLNDQLNILFNSTMSSDFVIEIYNCKGQRIKSVMFQHRPYNNVSIDLDELSSGIYLYRLKLDNNCYFNQFKISK